MAHELTQADVDKALARPPSDRRSVVADTQVPGFGMRLGLRRVTWQVRFMSPAPGVQKAIGSPPEMSLDVARTIARAAKVRHLNGDEISDAWLIEKARELGVDLPEPEAAPTAEPTKLDLGWHHYGKTDAKPASLEEIGRLIAICRHGGLNEVLAGAIEFCALTCLDRSDVVSIRHDQISSDVIRTDRSIEIQLTPRLLEIIQRTAGQTWVFPQQKRTAIGIQGHLAETSITATIKDLDAPQPMSIREAMRAPAAARPGFKGYKGGLLPFRFVHSDWPGEPDLAIVDLYVLTGWEKRLQPFIDAISIDEAKAAAAARVKAQRGRRKTN